MGYQVTINGPDCPALISLRAAAEGLPALELALGTTMPRTAADPVSGNGSLAVFGLGPDEWWVRIGTDEEGAWLARLETAAAGVSGAAVLVSDAYRVFTISGPGTLDVLAQATGVDIHPSVFPTGRAVRAAFARTVALIHRFDDRPAFEVFVDAALARYAGRWIEAAIGGRELRRTGTDRDPR